LSDNCRTMIVTPEEMRMTNNASTTRPTTAIMMMRQLPNPPPNRCQGKFEIRRANRS
jgi:hypothetical protein